MFTFPTQKDTCPRTSSLSIIEDTLSPTDPKRDVFEVCMIREKILPLFIIEMFGFEIGTEFLDTAVFRDTVFAKPENGTATNSIISATIAIFLAENVFVFIKKLYHILNKSQYIAGK
jgi:hypothetical protein